MRQSVTILLCATAVLTATLSCDDCADPPCTVMMLGTVEGYVTGGASPVEANLNLVPLDSSHEDDSYSVRADSTGFYTFTVPAGDYFRTAWYFSTKRYYTSGGGLGPKSQADTVTVGDPARRIDLAAGAATVLLDVPETLQEFSLDCRIGVRDGSRLDSYSWDQGDSAGSGRRFTFPFVPAGIYSLTLQVDRRAEIWLPPSWSPEDADTLTVETGAITNYEAALTDPAIIRGSVTGSWQEFPDHRPRIEVYDADSTEILYENLSSDPDYEFLLPVVAPIKLRVKIGNIARWIGGRDYASATVYDPQPGDIITGVDLEEGGIVCYLNYPGQFGDLEANFGLVDADSVPLGSRYPMGGGENPFFISNLTPGTYFLYLGRASSRQPWYSNWFDGAESFSEATPITIESPGEIKRITAHLADGGRITGRVLRYNGDPALGIRLTTLRTDEPERNDYATYSNHSDGSYEIVGLSNGDYLVGVYSYYYNVTSWYPGEFDPALADTIRVVDHGTVTGIEWPVSFLGGQP